MLKNGDYKDTVKEQPGSASVVQGVTEDRYAIGYSGTGYRTSGVRAVPLAETEAGPYFEGTYEEVTSGKYPLSRFLYVYVNKAPGKPLDPLPARVPEADAQQGRAGSRGQGRLHAADGKQVQEELAKIEVAGRAVARRRRRPSEHAMSVRNRRPSVRAGRGRIGRSPPDGGGGRAHQAPQADRSRSPSASSRSAASASSSASSGSWCSSPPRPMPLFRAARPTPTGASRWPGLDRRRPSTIGGARHRRVRAGISTRVDSNGTVAFFDPDTGARVFDRPVASLAGAAVTAVVAVADAATSSRSGTNDGRVALVQVRFTPVHEGGDVSGRQGRRRANAASSRSTRRSRAGCAASSYLEEGDRKIRRRADRPTREIALWWTDDGGAERASGRRVGRRRHRHRARGRPHRHRHRRHRPRRGPSLGAGRDARR